MWRGVNQTVGTFSTSLWRVAIPRCEQGVAIGNLCSGYQPEHKGVPLIKGSPKSLVEVGSNTGPVRTLTEV